MVRQHTVNVPYGSSNLSVSAMSKVIRKILRAGDSVGNQKSFFLKYSLPFGLVTQRRSEY